MKRTLLLPLLLLLLVSAAPATAPATRPAADRYVVQVRSVEYTVKPDAPPLDFAEVPADATELSSLEVSAEAGAPFEAVAIVKGTRYRLAGSLRTARGPEEHVGVNVEYEERSGGNVTAVKTHVVVVIDKPMRLGGMWPQIGSGNRALILALKRP
jgi:hypothetical protein